MAPSISQSLDASEAIVADTIGFIFIGLIVAAVLFGTSNLQIYHYYHAFPKDWKVFKASVAVLWVLDALHLVIISVVWSLKLAVVLNVIMIITVQAVYALRLWRFDHARPLSSSFVPIVVVVGVGVGVGLVLCVEVWKPSLWSEYQAKGSKWVILLSLGYIAVVDFSITAAVIFYIGGSQSSFSITGTLASKVIMWTLGTGLTTSICALISIILYITLPQKFIWITFQMLLPKLYFNSLLAMLNARESMRTTLNSKDSNELTSMNFAVAGAAAAAAFPTTITVHSELFDIRNSTAQHSVQTPSESDVEDKVGLAN